MELSAELRSASMKVELMRNPTGLCFVCGRSTQLLIHVECGKARDAERREKKDAHGFTEAHHAKARTNAAAKSYRRGVVPPFAKK